MKELRGIVVSGAGNAAFFTRLDWVREQCLQKLGFEPFPGTLNVEILPESLAGVQSLRSQKGISIIPADPNFCKAEVIGVSIGGIEAALVIPEAKARIHGNNTIEVIAPVKLKTTLDIEDGDTVEITVKVDGTADR
jgi:CTP-dependent riboflavin kinase